MKLITVPAYEQVAPEARPAFDQFIKTMGKMPNLYATIGYSPNALNSYLQYVRDQARGTFHAKDREGIYLVVSQLNGCGYCLASHTASAIKAGWKEEETLALRAGTFAENKWKAIYKVIHSVIENKGEVNNELLDEFFALGFDEKALVDLMALINVMTFTNYMFRLTKIPVDFPPARSL